MRSTRIAVVCAALLTLSATPTRAGLLVNGSFENPTVPAGGFSNFSGGSTAITGWNVVGDGVSIVSGTFKQNGITFEAQDGKQWLDLTGDGSNSKTDGVSQNVATAIGQSYQLSFYVGSTTDNSLFFASTVDLSIDGGTRVSYTNPTTPTNMLNWELFSVQFTATTTSTNITFFNGDAPNNNNSSLDNVTLSGLVPEPASFILLAVGVAGLAIGTARGRGTIRRLRGPDGAISN